MPPKAPRKCCPGGSASAFHTYDPEDPRPHFNDLGIAAPVSSFFSRETTESLEGTETRPVNEEAPSLQPQTPMAESESPQPPSIDLLAVPTLPSLVSLSAEIEAAAPGLLLADPDTKAEALQVQQSARIQQLEQHSARLLRVVARRRKDWQEDRRLARRVRTVALQGLSDQRLIEQQRRVIKQLEHQKRHLEEWADNLERRLSCASGSDESEWETVVNFATPEGPGLAISDEIDYLQDLRRREERLDRFETADDVKPNELETRFTRQCSAQDRIEVLMTHVYSQYQDLRLSDKRYLDLQRDNLELHERLDIMQDQEPGQHAEQGADSVHDRPVDAPMLQIRIDELEAKLKSAKKRESALGWENLELRVKVEEASQEAGPDEHAAPKPCAFHDTSLPNDTKALVDSLEKDLQCAKKNYSELQWKNTKLTEDTVRLVTDLNELRAEKRRCTWSRQRTLS